MKSTIRKNTEGGISISPEILKLAGLHVADELGLHVTDCSIVVTKKQMSANDLRAATEELLALAGEFSRKANEICAGCDGEDCPYLEDEDDEI